MISSGSDYMENLKSYYDKNTIKKILNDKKVLGIQSYDHYVNAFVKNYKGGVIEDDAIQSIQTKVNAIEDTWIESALKDIFFMFETETSAEENEVVTPPARPAPAEAKKESATPVLQQELTPRPPAEEERRQSEEAARRTAEEESLKKTKEEEEKRDAARKVAEEAARRAARRAAEEAKRRAQILNRGPPQAPPQVPPPTNEMKKEQEAEAKAEEDFKRKPEYIFNEKIMKEFQKYKHLFEKDIEFQRMTQ